MLTDARIRWLYEQWQKTDGSLTSDKPVEKIQQSCLESLKKSFDRQSLQLGISITGIQNVNSSVYALTLIKSSAHQNILWYENTINLSWQSKLKIVIF